MEFPKYDGNIHPNEWINDIKKYLIFRNINKGDHLGIAILFVDSFITLPAEIGSFEQLCNLLKEDISFTVFKNTNERMLQSLKYTPDRKGGNTSRFISNFRKLCYNAEINDVEKQKEHLYKSLPVDYLDHVSNEFHKKMKNVNSINELIKKFEDIIVDEANLITNESVVALKHVATGKYLSSNKDLNYTTGSKSQLVFADSSDLGPSSLWKINFNKELSTYTNGFITLQHVKSKMFLGINYGKSNNYEGEIYYKHCHNKSPSTNHTEVNCNDINWHNYWVKNWEFNYVKVRDHQGFLKSNDIINLRIKKFYDINGNYCQNGKYEFLRSHDIQFTIGNNIFQEVVCHNERFGGIDEWRIELFKHFI
ncbi:hypothetical protein RhiirA5_400737 [Rhizophagus irregularis]|uniref:MIR domain-containing protein n=1 Tax=Rhizophagus irregularis TaxID=588596 RepID=A0A2N0PG54_9GLOM|nr:hypothetical protein RhiirA5_400737 [Rhizophagus irregularis]